MDLQKQREAFLRQTVLENPYIKGTPTLKQAEFLTLPVREALFGGAAAGGKSFAILCCALQFVRTPGYAALLLRKTFSDLSKPGALIPMSHEFLTDTDARWNATNHQWTFPSGATLTFGYLDSDTAKYQYQGSEFAFIGFDELTHHTEDNYLYLMSRLRKAVTLNVPLRVRSTANPGGVGHEWVHKRFLLERKGVFIPSKMDDNPHIDASTYRENLERLDAVTRAQLLHGDWDIRPEGNLFKRAWLTKLLDRLQHKPVRVVRFWDCAATEESAGGDPDWTVGAKMARLDDDSFVLLDIRRGQWSPAEVERQIMRAAESDGPSVGIRMEQEGGSAGKTVIHHYARKLMKYDFRGVPARGDKVTRAQAFSATCERGNVSLIKAAWNTPFLDELCAFPVVKHDDQVDAVVGAYNDLASGARSWTAEDLKAFSDTDEYTGEVNYLSI